MLKNIAWRNVWRSKSRSFVVIGAIIVGMWALLFALGFMNSFISGYMQNIVRYELSHIQIHHPEFKKDYDPVFTIEENQEIFSELINTEEVVGVSERTLVNGMISSPTTATGIVIHGVIPAQEILVTRIDSMVVEGRFLEGISRNPVVISKNLADKLHVKLRSKVVLTFQTLEGNITAGAFRVSGIFKVPSQVINETVIYVRKQDLNRLLGNEDATHEIAILLNDESHMNEIKSRIDAGFNNLLVETWRDLAPELEVLEEQASTNKMILVGIIMLALIFGIINTMLMAVLERVKELGMLMAVGMNKGRVFFMVMIETMFMSFIGAPFGLLFGYITNNYLGTHGLDLSGYSEGLESFGYSRILYPELEPQNYVMVITGVAITAVLASIYPALKAIKLKPVEALHTV